MFHTTGLPQSWPIHTALSRPSDASSSSMSCDDLLLREVLVARVGARAAVAAHVGRDAAEAQRGEDRQLVPPGERQLGPAMDEDQQRRVFRSAGEIARRVARGLDGVFGDRECHGQEGPMEIDTGTNELLCVVRDGVALITLNRPEARNAMSPDLTPALRTQIKERGEDRQRRRAADHRRRHRLLHRRRRQGHGRPRPARPDELRGAPRRPALAPGRPHRRAGRRAQAHHRGAARRGGRRRPCHRARLRHPHRGAVGVLQHRLCAHRPDAATTASPGC